MFLLLVLFTSGVNRFTYECMMGFISVPALRGMYNALAGMFRRSDGLGIGRRGHGGFARRPGSRLVSLSLLFGLICSFHVVRSLYYFILDTAGLSRTQLPPCSRAVGRFPLPCLLLASRTPHFALLCAPPCFPGVPCLGTAGVACVLHSRLARSRVSLVSPWSAGAPRRAAAPRWPEDSAAGISARALFGAQLSALACALSSRVPAAAGCVVCFYFKVFRFTYGHPCYIRASAVLAGIRAVQAGILFRGHPHTVGIRI